MNVIQGVKLAGWQWNKILDSVVTILKYKESTIDHAIYIKVFSGGTVSYITISNGGVINTTNNKVNFSELRSF